MIPEKLRILLIEDNIDDAELIIRELKKMEQYEIQYERVDRVKDVINAVLHTQLDLIICDYYILNGDAENILEKLEELHADLPFVIVSGSESIEHIEGEQEDKAYKHAIISKNRLSRLISIVQREMRLVKSYHDTIMGWAKAIEIRDRETIGHSERVSELAVELARKIGMNEIEIIHLRRGALLHDVGKTMVSDTILLKPAALNTEELNSMRKHPEIAYSLLSPIEFLRQALDVPYCHHEHWDGSGYPRGLTGKDIPLAARLFTVIDVYDALTNDRPYRKAWSEREAITYLIEKRGVLFDPEVVDIFITIVEGK